MSKKLEPLSKRDFGAENDPSFNLQAAVDTFNWYMKSDRDEANMLLGMAISKNLVKTVTEHYDELQEVVEKGFQERLKFLENTVANSIISKSMSDDAVNATVEAVEVLKSLSTYTTYERSANANRQQRGAGGRFAPMGRTNIQYSRSQRRSPNLMGATQAAVIRNDRAAGQYQQAYQEVADALRMFNANGDHPIFGEMTVVDYDGNVNVRGVVGSTPEEIISPSDFRGVNPDKGNVRSITWYDRPELGASGVYADPLSRSGLAAHQFRQGSIEAGAVNQYESGTTRGMRQVGNAANVINNSGLADNASPKVKAALAAGKYVGEYGPEAETVIGPTIRRSAYRYRGVERAPDKEMIGAMAASTRDVQSPDDARRALMVPKNVKVETGFGLENRLEPSPFLKYWQSRLPDPELVDLHINSGAIAPSEGVIIGRTGEVVTQAVGYGDDHYLPFNLSKLSRAKGGEYVRTRTVGGPTTEDVYAGLMSGARSVTVVSHSGIYTVEFDPSFRGGRRYNDKAARMTQRYGMLTDSLASKQVQLQQIPPARRKEIRQQAEEEIPGNTPGIAEERKIRVDELRALERNNPKPSQEQKDEWTQDYLLDQAERISGTKTATNTPADREDMTPERLRAQMELREGRRFENDEEFIAALGQDKQYKDYMEFKSEEYRQSMKPLNLNGAGYHKALLALKEQFPYYISDVRYVPNQDVEGQRKRDKGYVKAKHLRSDQIKTGYFDQEIEGYSGQRINGKATGKRRASDENYANFNAHQRAKVIPRDDDDEGGGSSFSGGGSFTTERVASPGEDNEAPGMASSRAAMTHSGLTISRRSPNAGLQYSGWTDSPTLERGAIQTDWEQVNSLIKLRQGLRQIDKITYYDNNTRREASIWSDDPENPVIQQFPTLLSLEPDETWAANLQNSPLALENARNELQQLRAAQGSRNVNGAVYRSLEGKGKLVTQATGEDQMHPHPTSVRGTVVALKNGDEKYYDFTTGRRDGTYYLPGLTQREYYAAWNSDSDIQSFMATSEKRFGYRMSMTQDPYKFRGLSKDFGKAMNEGLDQADQWRKDLAKYGSPRNVPTHTVVKYGNKDYSIYSASDLENDIAKDALAVAKMKQLYQVNVMAMPDPDKPDTPHVRNIGVTDSSEQEEIDRTPDLRFPGGGGDKKERPVEYSVRNKRREVNDEKLSEARAEIDQMVGLDSAKREFDTLIQDAKISQIRADQGLPVENKTMHLVFTGQPGTGKTTYANALAKSYNALGILPKTTVTSVTRADLVGEYLGETAQKTRRVFDKGRGGVIFIDEAYALNSGEGDTYGKEAIDEIVALSENRRDDTVVILAGYPGDMNSLFNTNPGLKSRFPRTIKFPNYSSDELSDIATRQANKMEYALEPDASKEISRVSRRIKNAPNMSNARDTRNFIDDVSRAHTARISQIPEEDITREVLTSVTAEDVKAAEKSYFAERTGSVTKRLVPYAHH